MLVLRPVFPFADDAVCMVGAGYDNSARNSLLGLNDIGLVIIYGSKGVYFFVIYCIELFDFIHRRAVIHGEMKYSVFDVADRCIACFIRKTIHPFFEARWCEDGDHENN